MATSVALVTGGSSRIGEATAIKLHEAGCTVYAAARRVQRMEHLAEAGRVDVLVNNAGYGSYGALEDVPLSEARSQFEINVFGTARLTQLVLPQMREQHSGRIVNITSMGGRSTPARRLVPRHQVRPRSNQRLPAHGAQALRDRCRRDRTRWHQDRVG